MAAGNGGRHFDFNTMDANMHNIMVVTALDRKIEIAKFSNVPVFGAAEGAAGKFNFRALKAPGDDIVCKDAQLKYVSVSGTSAATAVMSGLAALCWGANPKLSSMQVEQILHRHGANAEALVKAAHNPAHSYNGQAPEGGIGKSMDPGAGPEFPATNPVQ